MTRWWVVSIQTFLIFTLGEMIQFDELMLLRWVEAHQLAPIMGLLGYPPMFC